MVIIKEENEEVVEIKVYGRGKDFKGVVLVDSDVYERLRTRSVSISSHGYARTGIDGSGEPLEYLHRFIMGEPKGKVVDHINGNRLDNRRVNLRICEHKENMWNSKPVTAGYKGVYENGFSWIAQIMADGVIHHIGSYRTQEEAALAYNEKALELHGEFAYLNVVGTPKEEWIVMEIKGQLKGEEANGVKLTEKKVLEIRVIMASGKVRNQDVAIVYGVDRRTVRDIASRRTWKHI